MKASLSSPSASFFELVGVSLARVLLPFSAVRIFFLNATHGKEKEALDVIFIKFEFHSREAWMEFKLAEDT
ncbi:hypothetical protein SAMN02745702_01932 [Desulfobaculum bizertense DSM 18034]|uniref:Uncharacterized protein n=1 Tax=Desulfobaculum bizertense DSM 18034 TaxID=1121442 RepID=A0A1T4WB25_9BACT|nr:hypothetical protein SAMN02745702_01932 [Desulfobaculum bizertense DSM 18034]